jgi:hypothetical protein
LADEVEEENKKKSTEEHHKQTPWIREYRRPSRGEELLGEVHS